MISHIQHKTIYFRNKSHLPGIIKGGFINSIRVQVSFITSVDGINPQTYREGGCHPPKGFSKFFPRG